MRFLRPGHLVASLAGAAVLTVGVSSALAAGSVGPGATCKYKLTNTPGVPTGTLAGSAKCSHPLGKGKATFKYTPVISPPDFGYSGSFKDKFKHGTLKGTFKVTGPFVPPNSPLSGKFKVSGGTGKLSKAHGSGTMICTTSDETAHMTCTAILTKGKL
jgi:hypothetical protein